jgi:polar amino acid transport system substrate-binding protein
MLSRRLFAAGAAGAPAILAGAARAEDQLAESTIDRIKRGKVLRIAALPGEAPYFNKDIASGAWSGMCIEMAKDIAGVFDGQVEYLESTYGNSVLDLQANKIDLAFALNPTPKRALVIDFTHPFYLHGFGMVGKKGFHAENWSDLNKPEVKVAVDIGSVHEIAARRFAPKATIIALKARDDCILAVQTGRADCVILAVNLGLDRSQEEPGARGIPDAASAARAVADLHGDSHGAGQALARFSQCLGRLQPRHPADPRMALRGFGHQWRQARRRAA